MCTRNFSLRVCFDGRAFINLLNIFTAYFASHHRQPITVVDLFPTPSNFRKLSSSSTSSVFIVVVVLAILSYENQRFIIVEIKIMSVAFFVNRLSNWKFKKIYNSEHGPSSIDVRFLNGRKKKSYFYAYSVAMGLHSVSMPVNM